MAEDIRSMRIELSMKDMGIKRTVAQINQSFRALKSEVSASNKIFQYGEKDLASYKNHVKELDAAHKVSQKNLSDLKRSYNELTDEQKTSSREGLAMQKSIAEQEKELHFLGRQLESAQSELKEFQKAQKIDSSSWTKAGRNISSMGDSLKGVSAKMGEVGSSLTSKITKPALVAASAVGGIALAKGWSRLVEIDNAKAKLSALGNSGKNVEKIMVNANTAVKGTSFGMGEAATTAANAVAAGIKPGKELTQYLTNTGDAAAVAGVGMDEMGRIFNKVQTSNKAYNGELQELSDRGLPIYQWLAKEAHVAASEITDMAADGKISSEMLQSAIENNIGGAAKKMGEKSFTASLANMWAALGRVGAGFLDAGGKGGGFFSKMKPLMNNLTTMFDGMQGSAEKWGVTFGNVLTAVVNKGVQLKNFYDGLPGPIQSVIKNTVLWGSMTLVAIGPMLLAFSKIAGAVSMVFGPFGNLLGVVGKVAVASKSAGGIIAGITSLFPKLGAAITFATGPIGITIMAIVALGTALVVAYKKSETFRNIVNTAFSGIVNGAKLLWSGVMAVLRPIGAAFAQFGGEIRKSIGSFWAENGPQFMQAMANIKTGFSVMWQVVKPIIMAIGAVFKAVFGAIVATVQFFMPVIQGLFRVGWAIIKYIIVSTWEAIKGVISGALKVIMGVIQIFSGLFTGNFKLMWQGVKNIFFGALQFIWNLVQLWFVGKIFGVFKLGLGLIKGIVSKSMGGIKAVFSWAIGGIWNIVKAGFTKTSSFTRSIFNGLWKFTKAVWSNIKLAVTNPVALIRKIVPNTFRTMSNVVRAIFNGLKKAISVIWRTLKTVVVNVAKALSNALRGNFSGMRKNLQNITNALKNMVIKLWRILKNTVISVAKSLWNGVKGIFKSLYNTAKNITQNLRDAVVKKWRNLKKSVVDLATGAKDGVVKGFKAMYNKGKEWLEKLKEFIGNAKAGFKKVATNLGKSVANGAISGLNAMIDGINTLSDKIMNKKLIKKKIPKLSTGTGANPLVKTDSQGRLTRSTKAVVNDKGIGNARGPGGHKELIRRRNGRIQQLAGSNRRVTLRKGDTVYNGAQSKMLRPHLSTGTGGMFDILGGGKKPKKEKHEKHNDVVTSAKDKLGDLWNTGKKAVSNGIESAKSLASSFGKKIGDVMEYATKPGKLVEMALKHFGVDFSNIKGEAMGGTINWAYDSLKNGIKNLVSGWFAELDGGDGDGGYIKYLDNITTPYSPNGPPPGYAFSWPHPGIDLPYIYEPVYSTISGKAFTKEMPGGFGHYIQVKGGALDVFYGHLSKWLVKNGQKVQPGTKLGISGNTGASTGPHLHYEMHKNGKPIDPVKWLKSHSGGGKKAPSKWIPDIKRAAKQMKVKLSGGDIDNIVSLIQHESGGDAGVTQHGYTDINTGGNEAQGLLQYVRGTFKNYAMKGHTNIKSGYDQLLAFFNNKYWRSQFNPNGGWSPSGPRRFATGGIINSNGLYNLAEDGHPEVVVPLDPARATDAMKLISYAQSKVNPGKNKRPNQVSNSYGKTGYDNSTELNLMAQQLEATREQNNLLMQLLGLTQDIKDQPKGYSERDISRDQGKRSVMQAYATGLL
ncbi:peptidoglycan DD-metalloendopeptidase family protein [Staphylococcus gallinarum]|uniref:peptidoglycan DD-metalloendopeptidase family protein n=1 Tax=Staphylococcus gallinarum TaxID=1293 RepID=UPI001C711F83|nr:peptidoglycan DD-metalloendopeptidase family protein [Staphylococcus gallinarum]